MHRKILAVLCAALLGHGLALAEPASKVVSTESSLAAVEKLGAIRARVSSKTDALWRLVNTGANGVNVAGNSLQAQYSQTVATLQKRVQQETAKPADARDQALIDSANAKAAKAYAMWNVYSSKDLPVFTQQMTELQNAAQGLYYIVAAFATQDQNWLRADLDPALLTSTLAAIDKRIDAITETATPLITKWIKTCGEREHDLQE